MTEEYLPHGDIIEVLIDGMPVPVLKEDWQNDPDKVTEEVRAAREAVLPPGLRPEERPKSYNEMYDDKGQE